MSVWEVFGGAFLAALGLSIIYQLLIRGVFTGNKYRKNEGRLWVKHPGGEWELLSEHMDKQKKLRENQ